MKKKYYYFGAVSVAFILGTMLVLPLWNKRSGFDIIMGNTNHSVTGDTLDVPEPYIYEDFIAPSNSFGMGDTTFKKVNWSYFKELFTSHCSWMLEYNSGNGWTDGNQFMTIEKTWNETLNGWKFNLVFTKPPSGMMDARFTFACDLPVLNYVERDGWQVNLNYTIPGTNEVYNCYFNWSDMANIPGVVFNKGVLDDMFWFRFRRDDIPANTETMVYEFDPTFGQSNNPSASAWLISYGSPVLKAGYGSPNSDGQVTNITAIFNEQNGLEAEDYCRFKFYLYEYVDDSSSYGGDRLAVTEESSNLYPEGWSYPYSLTLDLTSPYTVTSGTDYYLVVACSYETTSGNEYLGLGLYANSGFYLGGASANEPDDPWTGETKFTTGGYEACVYATYTEGLPNNVPEITLGNPVNSSGGLSSMNLSVQINDTEGDTMNISWYGDSSLIHTTSSVGNGTYYYTWNCGGGYHTWNVTVDDGTDNNNSGWRWFTSNYWNDSFNNVDNVSSSTNMTHTTGYYTTNALGSGSITIEGVRSAVEDPSLDVEIDVPNGVQDNDVLFVYLFHDNNDADDEFNTHDGWVQIHNLTDDPSGRGGTTWCGYHIVTDSGSEPSSYNFVHTDATSEDTGGIIVNLRGVDTSDVLANDTGYTYSFQANTGNFLSPDITTDEDNAMVLCMGSMSHAQTSCTAPSGTTLLNFTDHDYCNLMIAYYTQENSGATGDKQWTTDGVQEARGLQIAFKPLTSSGSVDSNLQTVNISKPSNASWNRIYAYYNCSSSNFTISILDNTTEDVILSGLDNNSDISSLSNDTIKLLFEITIACNFTGYNITWNETPMGDTWKAVATWNGTIFNNSVFNIVQNWNGTVFNNSNWFSKEDINGTIFNSSVFNLAQNWNGTIFNNSVFNELNLWNGTLSNLSVDWQNIQDITGTIFNSSIFNIVQNWNGTIYNSSIFNLAQDWNGSIFNNSIWHNPSFWVGTIFNSSVENWNNVADINGTIFNNSNWYDTLTWNGTLYNTSKWVLKQNINGTLFNSSIFNLAQNWNGTVFNQSSFNELNLWNGSVFNVSVENWNNVADFNGSIFNSSIFNIVQNWNGSIFNNSNWFSKEDINGSIFNNSVFNGLNIWNGSLCNISLDWQSIQDFNGSIFNSSGFESVNLWDGTLYNGTIRNYNPVETWDGLRIYNGTGDGESGIVPRMVGGDGLGLLPAFIMVGILIGGVVSIELVHKNNKKKNRRY